MIFGCLTLCGLACLKLTNWMISAPVITFLIVVGYIVYTSIDHGSSLDQIWHTTLWVAVAISCILCVGLLFMGQIPLAFLMVIIIVFIIPDDPTTITTPAPVVIAPDDSATITAPVFITTPAVVAPVTHCISVVCTHFRP
jgi:hypothetical protein